MTWRFGVNPFRLHYGYGYGYSFYPMIPMSRLRSSYTNQLPFLTLFIHILLLVLIPAVLCDIVWCGIVQSNAVTRLQSPVHT